MNYYRWCFKYFNLLLVICCVGLVGCGSSDSSSTEDDSLTAVSISSASEMEVGNIYTFTSPNLNDGYVKWVEQGLVMSWEVEQLQTFQRLRLGLNWHLGYFRWFRWNE